MFTLYIVLSRIGFCAGTNTYSVYCQQTRHETAQTVHTGSIYAAILKIAHFRLFISGMIPIRFKPQLKQHEKLSVTRFSTFKIGTTQP